MEEVELEEYAGLVKKEEMVDFAKKAQNLESLFRRDAKEVSVTLPIKREKPFAKITKGLEDVIKGVESEEASLEYEKRWMDTSYIQSMADDINSYTIPKEGPKKEEGSAGTETQDELSAEEIVRRKEEISTWIRTWWKDELGRADEYIGSLVNAFMSLDKGAIVREKNMAKISSTILTSYVRSRDMLERGYENKEKRELLSSVRSMETYNKGLSKALNETRAEILGLINRAQEDLQIRMVTIAEQQEVERQTSMREFYSMIMEKVEKTQEERTPIVLTTKAEDGSQEVMVDVNMALRMGRLMYLTAPELIREVNPEAIFERGEYQEFIERMAGSYLEGCRFDEVMAASIDVCMRRREEELKKEQEEEQYEENW